MEYLKWENSTAQYLSDVFQLNDFIARNPELGGKEYKAAEKIVALLRENKIDVEYPFAGFETAFKGVINPEKESRIAILTEYDALRGLGHGCGHCASGAASVLTALALNLNKEELPFGIDIIGTPDEEVGGAKCDMADAGIFDKYEFACMVHLGPVSTTEVDVIALDGMEIIFSGEAAHSAANPCEGKNALNAARLFMDATDMMRQHIHDTSRIHGVFKAGGKAANIVPDHTAIEFLTRDPKREYLNYVTEWVYDCAKAAALATKTTVEIIPEKPFHELQDSKLRKNILGECFDELEIEYMHEKGGFVGSSDIGNVDCRCVTFHPIMGIDKDCPLHSEVFVKKMTEPCTHEAIEKSAKYLIKLIGKLMSQPDLLKEIQEEHRLYRNKK